MTKRTASRKGQDPLVNARSGANGASRKDILVQCRSCLKPIKPKSWRKADFVERPMGRTAGIPMRFSPFPTAGVPFMALPPIRIASFAVGSSSPILASIISRAFPASWPSLSRDTFSSRDTGIASAELTAGSCPGPWMSSCGLSRLATWKA